MNNPKRQYPRQAWVLTPTFRLKEVTITQAYPSYGHYDYGDMTEAKKLYAVADMHETKEAAIAAGRAAVARVEADLAKRRTNLDKKIAALDAAEKQ